MYCLAESAGTGVQLAAAKETARREVNRRRADKWNSGKDDKKLMQPMYVVGSSQTSKGDRARALIVQILIKPDKAAMTIERRTKMVEKTDGYKTRHNYRREPEIRRSKGESHRRQRLSRSLVGVRADWEREGFGRRWKKANWAKGSRSKQRLI